jgi:hypothetical protein
VLPPKRQVLALLVPLIEVAQVVDPLVVFTRRLLTLVG